MPSQGLVEAIKDLHLFLQTAQRTSQVSCANRHFTLNISHNHLYEVGVTQTN